MGDSFGMMEGAYFISKNELLSWINDLLKVNLTKVEQLGTGAVYAQILDVIYPGEVAVHKLNWKARLEWEFVNNFKVLQQGFQKLGISKYIDVPKLDKAKYQDNLEFGQWMKRFYEIKLGKEGRKDYDPVERRGGVEPDFSFVEHKIPTKANLDYVNYPANGSAKRVGKTKDCDSVQNIVKKVKLNTGDGKENKGNSVELKEKYERVKQERDIIQEKLDFVENMLSNHEATDSDIIQNLRNFLGMNHREEAGNGEEHLFNENESKEVLMLIEGESI